MNPTIRQLIASCTPSKLLDMEMAELMANIDHEDRIYMFAGPGKEHYRLLAYLSHGLKDALIIEYGTYRGLSAVCLASNPQNRAISVDIEDNCKIIERPENLKIVTNPQEVVFGYFCSTCEPQFQRAGDLVLLDTNHDGIFERKLFDTFEKYNYKGAVILDDIHLTTEEHGSAMPDFWASIKQEKHDITHLGHWSGTGIVYFS